MFQLLSELIELHGDQLNEDLGKLRELGLGRMINAFKQQYYATGGGRNRSEVIATAPVSSKLNHYSGIGENSESIDLGAVSTFNKVVKAIKENQATVGVIYSIDNKVVALHIGEAYSLVTAKATVGLAWDFTDITGVNEPELAHILSLIDEKSHEARKHHYNRHHEVFSHPLKSRHSVERETYSNDEIFVHHFEGVAQVNKQVLEFFKQLFQLLGSRIHVKLILSDQKSFAKKNQRWSNRPISRSDLKLFSDDIKTRLAKYKNTKVQSVEDMETFIAKVFSGEAKKLTFAGLTYHAIPKAHNLGANDSIKYTKPKQVIYYKNDTMQRLLTGKEVPMEFESDSKAGQYQSLTVSVKFQNGMLVPTTATYFDANQKKYVTEKL